MALSAAFRARKSMVVNSLEAVLSVIAEPPLFSVLAVRVVPVRVPESVIAPPPVKVTVLVVCAAATSKPVASR